MRSSTTIRRLSSALCLSMAAAGASAQVEIGSIGTVNGQLPANSSSQRPAVSSDGRYVVFQTNATNLGVPVSADYGDIVLLDRQTSALSIVSRNGATPENGLSSNPDISGDGNLIVFASTASNLVPGDTNAREDIFVFNRTGNTLSRLVPGLGIEPDGDSFAPRISGNGTRVIFVSTATNWVAGDTNATQDVFALDLAGGAVQRVSIGALGEQPNANVEPYVNSAGPTISADAQCVAFTTTATNLVANDTNANQDVFLRNITAGTTTRVSTTSGGLEANGASIAPALGSDCSFLAFGSSATNLNADVNNNYGLAAFAKDLVGGTVTRIWPPVGGPTGFQAQANAIAVARDGSFVATGNYFSGVPLELWQRSNQALTAIGTFIGPPGGVSDSGAIVVFDSPLPFGAGDTNFFSDVGVFTRAGSTVAQLSAPVPSSTLAANGPSGFGSPFSQAAVYGTSHQQYLSADGNLLAFSSFATNLVAGDTNGYEDVFVRDRLAGTNVRISAPIGGGEANGDSWVHDISPDGRFVLFDSCASNLVPGDTNGVCDLFLADRVANTIERVNVSTAGAQVALAGQSLTNGHWGSISADGRYVAFACDDVNALVTGLTGYSNSTAFVFLRDRVANTTTLISSGLAGAQANGGSRVPRISRDGRFVAFESSASNLVAGDTNSNTDIFVVTLAGNTTERVSIATNGSQGNSASSRPFITDNGRYVVFTSSSSNLLASDTNAQPDVFVRDRTLNTTTRISVSRTGAELPGDSFDAGISALGYVVPFITNEGGPVGFDNAAYVYNLATGHVDQVFPTPGLNQILRMTMSGDGRYLTFSNTATTLVVPDGNFQIRDVFVAPYLTGVTGGTDLIPLAPLPPPASSGSSGASVAAAPGIVVVGAPDSDADGTTAGQVFVYTPGDAPAAQARFRDALRSGKSIKEVQDLNLATLQMPPELANIADKFGGAVAVSHDGDTVAVGAPNQNNNRGAIYIFKKPADGWTGKVLPAQAPLTAPAPVNGDGLGVSIAITNSGTIIAGAPGTGNGAGAIYVIRKGDTTYTVSTTITAQNPQAGAGFGSSVSGEGSDIVVGAPNRDVSGHVDQGQVQVFREAGGVISAMPLATVNDPAAAAGDQFGASVAINNGTLLVGAPGHDRPAAPDSGAAEVFDAEALSQVPDGTATPTATLTDPSGDTGAALGSSVTLTDSTAVIGEPNVDINGNVDQGGALVYTAPENTIITGTPVPDGQLFDPTGDAGDHYGTAVYFGGGLLVSGSPDAGTQAARSAKSTTDVKPGEAIAYSDSVIFKSGMESVRGAIDTCTSPNLPIPDNDPAGVTSDLPLTATGNVKDLNIAVRITHSFVSDLRLTLIHVPTGRTVPLYAPAPSASCDSDDMDLVFDDQALDGFARVQCSAGTPAIEGRFLPNDWLTIMQGVARAGPWRLKVADVSAAGTGTLVSWCVDAR